MIERQISRRGRAVGLSLVTLVSAWIMGSAQLIAAEHIVEIKQFDFVPSQLTVKPGDTIKWVNRDIIPHTATAKDRSWDTKLLKKGEAMSIIVTKDMNTDYFCRFHPGMKAKLVLDLSQ